LRKKVDTLLERLLITVSIIMLIAVVLQVISRYIFNSPTTFTDEIASFSLIWLGLLGAAYASGKELHLAIDLIPESTVKKSPRFFYGFVTFFVMLFAFLVMVVGGFRLCYLTWELGQKSAVLKIPLAVIYIVLPLSGLLILFYSLDSYNRKIKSL